MTWAFSLRRDWPRYTAARLVGKLLGLVIPPRDGQSLPFLKATRKTKWSCCASSGAVHHGRGQRKGEARCISNQVLVGGYLDPCSCTYLFCLTAERKTTRGLGWTGVPLKIDLTGRPGRYFASLFGLGQVSEGLRSDSLAKRNSPNCFLYTEGVR